MGRDSHKALCIHINQEGEWTPARDWGEKGRSWGKGGPRPPIKLPPPSPPPAKADYIGPAPAL